MQSQVQVQVRVWDLYVRVFHWALVSGFALCYLSAKFNFMTVHVYIGYLLSGLLLSRLIWGFIGPAHARFRDFLYSPAETLRYSQSLLRGHPTDYLSHNPLGALMVFALLAICLAICASGLTTLAVIDFDGPLTYFTANVSDDDAYAIQEVHEFLPNITLILIGLHVAGVILSSRLHNENLVRSMVTGYKLRPLRPRSDKF